MSQMFTSSIMALSITRKHSTTRSFFVPACARRNPAIRRRDEMSFDEVDRQRLPEDEIWAMQDF